jgi:IS30 family transposase
MPAERVAMRQVREIIRLKFSAGLPTREIARRLGVAASTVRETLRRFDNLSKLHYSGPHGLQAPETVQDIARYLSLAEREMNKKAARRRR